MKDIETVVSENIKKLLKEYNINQVELAKIAGVSESTVGKWVLEKASPRMGSIEKIANHFNLPKSYILQEDNLVMEKKGYYGFGKGKNYNYFPTAISAGLPMEVDGITESSKITLADELLGKYKNDQSLFFARASGDSMDKRFKNDALIGIKPLSIEQLNNGDIVVYSDAYDYSVKHYYRYGDTIVFKPDSTNPVHKEHVYNVNDNIMIHGKVVVSVNTYD